MQQSPLLSALINTPAPPQLYHYTSVSGLQGILLSRSAWATAAQYLSDARELRHALDLARSRLSEHQANATSPPRAGLLAYLQEQLERTEHFPVCVFSLSEEDDLLSQWRGYCPIDAGYSIGFLTAGLGPVLAAEGCIMAPCVYDAPRQVALVREAVDPVVDSLPDTVPAATDELRALGETFVPQLFSRLLLVAPLIKDPSFSEEKEWRVVWTPNPANVERFEYRVGRSMLIPHVAIKLEAPGHPFPLGDIVIGPTAHQYQANNSLSGFLQRHQVPWTAIRPSRIPYRQF